MPFCVSVKVFDILYINLAGARAPTLLTRKTLNVRLQTLKGLGLFREVPGRFEFVAQRVGKTAEDVEHFLQEIIEVRYASVTVHLMNVQG